MPTPRDEILNAALGLSESDRLAIAVRLMESLPESQPGLADDDDLAGELERRSGDSDDAVDWTDLREQLRASSLERINQKYGDDLKRLAE